MFLVTFFSVATLVTAAVRNPCGSDSWKWINTQTGTKCVLFLPNTALHWSDAQTRCMQLGGNLITFENVAELAFVSGLRVLYHPYGNFWIGAKKGDFEWNWMKTKTEVERPLGTELTHWRAGEPQHGFHNKFCAYMLESGRLGVSWDDGWCTNKFKVICQKNV